MATTAMATPESPPPTTYTPDLDAFTSLQLILKTARLSYMIKGSVEKGYYTLYDHWHFWTKTFFDSLPMPVSEVLHYELEFYRDPRDSLCSSMDDTKDSASSPEDGDKREAQVTLWEKLHACAEWLRKALKVLEKLDLESEEKVVPDDPNWPELSETIEALRSTVDELTNNKFIYALCSQQEAQYWMAKPSLTEDHDSSLYMTDKALYFILRRISGSGVHARTNSTILDFLGNRYKNNRDYPSTGQLRYKVINAFKDTFKGQLDGFESINDPANGTLEGLFENDESAMRSGTITCLMEWLATKESRHDNLCWIKGHPGSGKSVLMKYMVNKLRMDPSLLGTPAGTKPPIILSHFYVNDGNGQMARNYTMIYHLLFQLFTEEPQLVEDVFFCSYYRLASCDGWRKTTLPTFLREPDKSPSGWSLEKAKWGLLDALRGRDNTRRLYIFLDGPSGFNLHLGTDEFPDYNFRFFKDLVEKIVTTCREGEGVKVCLASRPEGGFYDYHLSYDPVDKKLPTTSADEEPRTKPQVIFMGNITNGPACPEPGKLADRDTTFKIYTSIIEQARLQPERFYKLAVFIKRILALSSPDIANVRERRPFTLLELTLLLSDPRLIEPFYDQLNNRPCAFAIKGLCELMEDIVNTELYPFLTIRDWNLTETDERKYLLRFFAQELTPFAYKTIGFVYPRSMQAFFMHTKEGREFLDVNGIAKSELVRTMERASEWDLKFRLRSLDNPRQHIYNLYWGPVGSRREEEWKREMERKRRRGE